jgi:hypothetical protein
MARISNEQRLHNLHAEALAEFDKVQSALRDERMQCLQDRRFYSLAGAQWEGPLWDQYENKPKFEVNKIHMAVIRIINEYRNNRVSVDFVSKEGSEYDKLADTLDGLLRADEQDSVASEAYDNAFEEAVGGGFGAWRLRTEYEDDEDDENEKQRICIEPIFDADSSVFFDLQAKRQDKSDAKFCYVLTAMTRDAYREAYEDDPTTWPKTVHQYEFDWMTPDIVFIAEYYRVEEVNETIRIFQRIDGEEERYRREDFENDETLEDTLAAIGTVEVRQKRVKRRKIRKYIMSGGRVLEDCGYIAGKNIPIVPVYGKRWFVDNIERCMGHVRLAKDAQRLRNMQLSKLGEIAALSSVEKPILTPEQVAGHQLMWAEDNIKDYPYLLINPVTSADGSMQVSPPVGYTRSPAIPPALAGIISVTEQDMKDVLGNQEQGDKIVSNISGKAVEMIQQRLDMQTFIYMSNFAKAMKRCGEIWLSMAQEIYVEEGRSMKAVNENGDVSSVELMKPAINTNGEMEYENDISSAKFDVDVQVGPTSQSKRAATVKALTGMLAITTDPETQQVLQAMAMMNMEGEGISDVRDFFRKKLLKLGVIKPSDEEAQELMIEIQGQPQDPNTIFLQAAAEEAVAKAAQARANTVLTVAKAEETQAKTLETMSKIGGEVTITAQPEMASAPEQSQPQAQPEPMNDNADIERMKMELELEGLRADTAMKIARLAEMESKLSREREDSQMNNVMAESVKSMQEMMDDLNKKMQEFQDSVDGLSKSSKETADKAIEAIKRPKRIIRENGKIVGIETE